MTTYTARMEGAEQVLDATTLEEALEATREWAAEGSWDTTGGTIWVHAYCIEDEDGDITPHPVTVTIDPPEPTCCRDGQEHNWQAPHSIVGGIESNPGVWGHGGGVTIQEVCMHCGCGKLTDTWAQDPETGEQGLESVTYQPGKYQLPQEDE